ncbi:MAG TPA: hypothetical protein VK588_02225 [Chitinophagaceae bacterium]|nr:hypothetical protein [Chitinophagaceae bacterium]
MQIPKSISKDLAYFLQIVVGLTSYQIQELAMSGKIAATEEAFRAITAIIEKKHLALVD